MVQDDKEKKVTNSEIDETSNEQQDFVEKEENKETSLEKEDEESIPESAVSNSDVEMKETPVGAGEEDAMEIKNEEKQEEKEEEDHPEPKIEAKKTTLKPTPEVMEITSDDTEVAPEKDPSDSSKNEIEDTKSESEEPDKEEENSEAETEQYEHHLDYSNHSKAQLVQVLESEIKDNDMMQVGKILKEIKPAFDEIYNDEREKAYEKYIEQGGDKDGFEYKNDDLDERFLKAFNALREKRHSFYNDQEKQKDKNLQMKQSILEKLRTIVDSDETIASLKDLKEIQEEWKKTGPVAPQHLKSMWANYNALIDRYYDQRSIYFELKELDRKKNLESKLELCEKAEELEAAGNIKDAIKQLNDLHEEFKHIGPVPKDDQEAVWKRFKTASDAIYSKRKDYFDKLKDELKINQVAKEALAEKVQVFSEFTSEKISEWNQKTKEILEVQREWEKAGGLPREVAREINKNFWTAFKTFFNHKGQFFKQIEKARHENLKLKEELVQKAEELKESDDFHKTAEELKVLQKEWKDVGPVPEKQRNEIYAKFKAACDHFFNRRREIDNQQEKSFTSNLKKKQELCDEIDAMIASKDVDINRLDEIIDMWADIGFVPRNEIKSIQQRFVNTVSKAADFAGLDEEDTRQLKFSAQFNKLKQGPNSNRIIQKKENSLRRQIAKLENDIDLWKNNLNFFAESKTADKLKAEFNEKIDKAAKELSMLEDQLRAISNL